MNDLWNIYFNDLIKSPMTYLGVFTIICVIFFYIIIRNEKKKLNSSPQKSP